jgi:hypothetical protein
MRSSAVCPLPWPERTCMSSRPTGGRSRPQAPRLNATRRDCSNVTADNQRLGSAAPTRTSPRPSTLLTEVARPDRPGGWRSSGSDAPVGGPTLAARGRAGAADAAPPSSRSAPCWSHCRFTPRSIAGLGVALGQRFRSRPSVNACAAGGSAAPLPADLCHHACTRRNRLIAACIPGCCPDSGAGRSSWTTGRRIRRARPGVGGGAIPGEIFPRSQLRHRGGQHDNVGTGAYPASTSPCSIMTMCLRRAPGQLSNTPRQSRRRSHTATTTCCVGTVLRRSVLQARLLAGTLRNHNYVLHCVMAPMPASERSAVPAGV